MVELWNWARTFSCRPRWYVEPKTIEEIRSTLKEVTKNGWKVRVMGCGHSPSALALSNEVLISMKHFNRILEIDSLSAQIHCESGVLLRTLNEVLPEHQLSLPVQGSVSGITIAGTVSTATHGSGLSYGSLSSYVLGLTLMKLDGEVREYRLEDDEELFRCLTCSLGTFGIIISVRLQVSPLFYLSLNQYSLEFHQLLNSLSVHCLSSDHFRYMWYPHTNRGIAYHLTRVEPQPLPPSSRSSLFSWIRSSLIGHHLLELLFYLSLSMPRLVPWINNLYVRLDGGVPVHRLARCDQLFNFDCLFRQYASEWSVPLDEAVSCLGELEAAIEAHGDVHFPIEIRFSKCEDLSYLSPSFGRPSCWINTVSYRPYGRSHSRHRAFFRAFEQICGKYQGRPHWAKEHPLTGRELSRLYPHWQIFVRRREQFDPTNILLNECLHSIFL